MKEVSNFIIPTGKSTWIFDWGRQVISLQKITNKSKIQDVHKIFTKTIGQSHKNHELNSETIA